jgi:NAD(P)H-nitrite reductase large subunit
MQPSFHGLRHVIIGNGVAGTLCAETLRKLDPSSDVTLIGGEPYPLYNRVSLPPFLKGKVQERKVLMRTVEQHAERGVKLLLETHVTHVSAQDKVVYTESGAALPYDRLLVASGGFARSIDVAGAQGVRGIYNFQTLDDTRAIIAHAERATRAVVFGGSYIAYELADALAERGLAVTWIMRGPHLLHRILDAEGGAVVDAIARAHGVRMLTGNRVAEVLSRNDQFTGVITGQGETIEADMLCCGLGLTYSHGFLVGTGVHVDQGVVADEYLCTTEPDIFTAGDVAEAKNLTTGLHEVMGTWDSASAQGRQAARNMLGEKVAFDEPSVYTSTMFHTKMRAVGRTPKPHDEYAAVSTTDIQRNTHFKLFFERDVLVGAVSIGDMPRRAELLHLIRSKEPITDKFRLLTPA